MRVVIIVGVVFWGKMIKSFCYRHGKIIEEGGTAVERGKCSEITWSRQS